MQSQKPDPAAATTSDQQARERRRRYVRGHLAEHVAMAYLMAKGHRILARRFKTHVGEIDLITRKGRRIAFIEVKRRKTLADCEDSITQKLRYRVRAAANLWMAKHPVYHDHDQGFDLVFIVPWHLPDHRQDSL